MDKVNKSNMNKQKNKNVRVVKKTRFNYDKACVKLAVAEAVGGVTVAEVSRKYNIPESTIRAKIKNKCSEKRPGALTVLSEEEENELVEWIFFCCKQGFPVTKQKLIESVKLICDNDTQRKTPFINNKPGRSWLEGFFKRHPNVSERVSENLSLTRAKVTEYGIRGWFKEVGKYFIQASTDEDDLLKIDPSRVFNADEIGVSMNPKPSSVLAPKGTKNVYSVVGNNEKENVTVLVTANAAGTLAPTLVLFAGQSVPKNVIKVASSNFSFGYSDNGWMTAKNFYEYLTNVFFPWVVQNNIKLPIVLYIDGHCSHVTAPLSKFCSENQIILVALYPNATHILQPLDVALFRTFRAAYQKSFQHLCELSGTISIKKSQVVYVLKKAFESLDLKKIMENGFKTCGLHPFDVDAIDYSKVFKKLENVSAEAPSSVDKVSNGPKNSEALKFLESLIDDEKLTSFRVNNSSSWEGRKEDQSLFNIWYKLASQTSVAQEENIYDNNEAIQSPVEIGNIQMSEDQTSTPSDPVPNNTTDHIRIGEWNANIEENGFGHYMVGVHGDLVPVSEETSESSFSTTSYFQNSVQENLSSTLITPEITTNIQASNLTLPASSPTADTVTNLSDQGNFSTRSEKSNIKNLINLLSETDTISSIDSKEPPIMEEIQNPARSIESPAPTSEQLQSELPLGNIVNADPVTNKFSDALKNLCHWPKLDVSKKKKKRSNKFIQVPSVLSSAQWQQVQEAKENEELLNKEEAILRKKMKIELREFKKTEKDKGRARKEEERLEKEKEKLEKERERILKNQKRMQDLEAKRKLQEESLQKKIKAAEIRKKLAELQKEAELLGNNE